MISIREKVYQDASLHVGSPQKDDSGCITGFGGQESQFEFHDDAEEQPSFQ